MSQEHNNIKSRKYKQIKFRDHIVIETLRKQGQLASKRPLQKSLYINFYNGVETQMKLRGLNPIKY